MKRGGRRNRTMQVGKEAQKKEIGPSTITKSKWKKGSRIKTNKKRIYIKLTCVRIHIIYCIYYITACQLISFFILKISFTTNL